MALLDALSIVNAACALIGEEPLQTMDDETDAGQSASLLYEKVVDFNLDIYVFSFSMVIRQLSRDDNAAALAGYTYVYDLPAERIGAPVYLTDDPTDENKRFRKYALIGSQAHTDAAEIFAKIRYRPEPRNWSPTFRSATITALSADLAISLAHDRALADAKRVEAYGTTSDDYRGGQMRAAIRADAFATPTRAQDRDDNPLTNAWRR